MSTRAQPLSPVAKAERNRQRREAAWKYTKEGVGLAVQVVSLFGGYKGLKEGGPRGRKGSS